jgi:hypothetical protein
VVQVRAEGPKAPEAARPERAKLANSELPLKISLINNRFWQIEGSLPPNMTGGTAIIVIKKDDGQIQYIRHTK